MSCEHDVNSWPCVRVTEKPPWWKFWGQTYGEIAWFCRKCGARMEPVYRVKEEDNG